jgi:5-methylthioadenosine/S-adenosylhomocysteine deaminase
MDYPPPFMETPERIIGETTRLFETWHNQADGRVRVEFGPLIPWGCSDETMRRTYDLAQSWGVGTHIHIAETQAEIDINLEKRGSRHVEWLAELGILGPDVQLVHSVWLDEKEIDLVAQRGAVVVHCPVSNMYLASGVPAVCQMLARGIPIAMGTDGPGSQNSQDMLESLKIAALLAKVSTCDANAVLPLDLLRMATVDGARLMGRDDIGRIVPGALADLTLVNLNNARSMPVHRPESAVVYNASGADVHTVLVEGRILLDAGQVTVLDEAALLEECRQAARDLLRRANVEI